MFLEAGTTSGQSGFVLLTHIGDDNLPGINSMLRRKIAEREEEQSQESTANSDWTKNMISPGYWSYVCQHASEPRKP